MRFLKNLRLICKDRIILVYEAIDNMLKPRRKNICKFDYVNICKLDYIKHFIALYETLKIIKVMNLG